MNKLPRNSLRLATTLVLVFGLAAVSQGAANPKAGDRPNPKSSETHPGDERAAEGKAKAAENKAKAAENKAKAQDKSALERYDANRNGKLDPDELAAMQADKEKSPGKGKGRGKKDN